MQRQARDIGANRALAMCSGFLGTADYMRGRFPEAMQNLLMARELYDGIDSAAGEAIMLQRLGVVATALGRLEEARDYLRQGINIAEKAMMKHHCLVRLYAALGRNRLEAGDYAAALVAVEAGLEVEAQHGSCITCNVMLYPVAAMAFAVNGHIEKALFCVTKSEESATAYGSHYFFGLTYQVQGLLLGFSQNWQQARSKLRLAKSEFESIRVFYEVARCDLFLAQVLMQKGGVKDFQDAKKLLTHVLPVFEQMGAEVMATQARGALAMLAGQKIISMA